MYLKNTKIRYQYLLEILGGQDAPNGCSIDEIDAIAQGLGLNLPQAYREFLEWTGKSGGCFAGDYFDCNRVLKFNQSHCRWMLEKSNQFDSFPKDAIFIIVYQGGYGFEFICASEGENPPVHRGIETESETVAITWNYAENLDEFCLDTIDRLIKAYEK